MSFPEIQVDFDRLRNDIQTLGEIGRWEDHGIYRMAFTAEDMEARQWLRGRIEEAGLEFEQDGAANLFGRINCAEDKPSVLMGSHIDTVPAGGHLDGALGVLTALECLRRIREEKIHTKYGLEMASFSDEEGRFGGLLGSQALSGDLTPETVRSACDLQGNNLVDIMADHGLDARDVLQARRSPQTIHAYLELHIEQGPVLDSRNLSLGIVEQITGLFKWHVRLVGQADHAGTTPMNMRRDAFRGLAEFADEISRVLEEDGGEDSVATVGSIELFPGTANTVPGQVEFSLDVRDPHAGTLAELSRAFRKTLSAIGRRRSLMFEFDVLNEMEPVDCNPGIIAAIEQSAGDLDIEYHRMPSGAVHDAVPISHLAPVGMIFVPSKDGRSHSPAEWTHWEDIERGANVALRTLLRMAEAQ